eukprot:g2385.t1
MKIGYVVSDKMPKTRVALIEYYLFNAKYGSWYKRMKKKHFHDEYEISKLGDVVLIAPYRSHLVSVLSAQEEKQNEMVPFDRGHAEERCP